MQLSLVPATLLCLITWITLVQASGAPVENCSCAMLSNTRPHPDMIVDYTIQKETICPIGAVIFRTVRGITLCSDPNSRWTKKVIGKVNAKRKASLKKTQNKGSASVTTPAASTASTNAPPQKSLDWTVTTEVGKTQNEEGSTSVMTPAASTAP